jgi:hypothetical protein
MPLGFAEYETKRVLTSDTFSLSLVRQAYLREIHFPPHLSEEEHGLLSRLVLLFARRSR